MIKFNMIYGSLNKLSRFSTDKVECITGSIFDNSIFDYLIPPNSLPKRHANENSYGFVSKPYSSSSVTFARAEKQ